MSELFNRYLTNPQGRALLPEPVPLLRAEGAPLAPAQLGMARFVFERYLERSRLSYVPNPVEQGFLPDGSRYRVGTVGGMRIMQVWPVVPAEGIVPEAAPAPTGILIRTSSTDGERFFIITYTEVEPGVEDFVVTNSGQGYCGSVPVVRGIHPHIKYFNTNFGMYTNPDTPKSLVKYGEGRIEEDIYHSDGYSNKAVKYKTNYMPRSSVKCLNLDATGNSVIGIDVRSRGNFSIYSGVDSSGYVADIVAEGRLIMPPGGYSGGMDPVIGRLKDGGFLITTYRTKYAPELGMRRYRAFSQMLGKISQLEEYSLNCIPVNTYTADDEEVLSEIHVVKGHYEKSDNGDVQEAEIERSVIDNGTNRRYLRKTSSREQELVETFRVGYIRHYKVNNPPSVPHYIEPFEATAHRFTDELFFAAMDTANFYTEEEDSIFLKRYVDTEGNLYDARLIVEVTGDNTVEVAHHHRPIRQHLPFEVDYMSHDWLIVETTTFPLPPPSELPKDWRRSTIKTNGNIVLMLGDTSIPLLTSCSETTCRRYVKYANNVIKLIGEEDSEYDVEGTCTSRVPIGFEPLTKTLCFIEVVENITGFTEPEDKITVPLKVHTEALVYFTVYRGDRKIYSKELPSYNGTSTFSSDAFSVGNIYGAPNIRLDRAPEDKLEYVEYENDYLPAQLVRRIRKPGYFTAKGNYISSRYQLEEYPLFAPEGGKNDNKYSHRLLRWDPYIRETEVNSDSGDSITALLPGERLSINLLSANIPPEHIEDYAVEVWFGIDPHSFSLAVVCKHAKLLITPDGSVRELSSVLPPNSGEVQEWCAST